MKKTVLGLFAGLAFGAFATWLMLSLESATVAEAEHDHAAATLAPATSGRVHLSKGEQTAAGLITGAPRAGHLSLELEAYGRVLDPAPLVALTAEVDAAQATLDASEKDLARTTKLHAADGNASTQALEAAEAAVARDRAQLAAAHAQLSAAWGPAPAGRDDRTAFLRDLVTRSSALVRIDLPSGETLVSAPTEVRAATIGAVNRHTVEIVGPAPTVDAQMQGLAYLGVWNDDAPAIGTALQVLVPTGKEPRSVWLVPRSALVRHQGRVFVYVQSADDTFVRRRVVPAEPEGDEVPVTEGLDGDERIVVTGAQQLLSTELDAGGEPD